MSRYFGFVREVHPVTLTVYWHLGTSVGMTILRYLLPRLTDEQAGAPLDRSALRDVAILSVPVGLASVLSAWAHWTAPIAVIRPMFQVAEVILPLLIGLYLFGERRVMGKRLTWLAVVVAAVGCLLIARSYGIGKG